MAWVKSYFFWPKLRGFIYPFHNRKGSYELLWMIHLQPLLQLLLWLPGVFPVCTIKLSVLLKSFFNMLNLGLIFPVLMSNAD